MNNIESHSIIHVSFGQTYPSVKSACNKLKYVSHLFPMTLPHVKQRTGIIIVSFAMDDGADGGMRMPSYMDNMEVLCVVVCVAVLLSTLCANA